MSIKTGGPQSAQQLQQDRIRKGQDRPDSGKQVMNKAIKLINSARTGGVSMTRNFIDQGNLDALMLAVMSERAEILEEALREQVQEVRNKNNKLKEANQIMAKARNAKKGSSGSKKTGMPSEVRDFFAKNNIPWGKGGSIDPNNNYSLKSGEWDLAIENMKGWTESLTSTSQLDMTKLQSTSGKFNQTFEMMSQFISKYYRSGDNIIKNI